MLHPISIGFIPIFGERCESSGPGGRAGPGRPGLSRPGLGVTGAKKLTTRMGQCHGEDVCGANATYMVNNICIYNIYIHIIYMYAIYNIYNI